MCALYHRMLIAHKRSEDAIRSQLIQLSQENEVLNRTIQGLLEGKGNTPAESKVRKSKLSARESLLMVHLNNAVNKHYTNPEFGVDDLAQAIGMSRSSLNRKMRELLHTTANHYIRDIRIAKAEELLRTSSLQINEICYKVGFQTPSYFIKCFRKKFGMSPNEYSHSDYR